MPGQDVCQNTSVASSSVITNESEWTCFRQGLDDQVPSSSSYQMSSSDLVLVSTVEYPAPIPTFFVSVSS